MADSSSNLVWIILGLPLLGSIIQALFGKRVIDSLGTAAGRRVMGWLAVLPIAIAFVLGVILTFGLSNQAPDARSHVATLYPWIDIQSIRIPFEALIDPLSMTMTLIITGVGALIHLYATGYMGEERDYSRFFTYLNLFISCMLILVLANNLALMFIGWEGVGLCSYLLIAFWYKDVSNAKAGNKAFIVNRIGDWGLTLGIFMIFSLFVAYQNELKIPANGRFLSYDVVLPNALRLLYLHPWAATAIALLLFIGACGKSAQFPLYFWLPDAMAGPTPVSALIHAATMVTAGVFLVNRMHVFFEMSAVASAVVACTGAFTAVFAALVAFGQTDIKKVLAYSTVSQLGFMFVACGAGGYWAGIFHVTTHAFFKALLFLGAGAIIHAMAHNQDMRNYGNLFKYLKITSATMIIGWLAISGIPPLAGFFSKEAIIGNALGNQNAIVGGTNFAAISGWVALFAAMLTAWYMTRLTMLTFFGKEERWRSMEPSHDAHHAHGHTHEHVHGEHHGDDHFGFFFSEEEAAGRTEPQEEHHELDKNHTPREVPPSMWVPLVVLAALAVIGGWVLNQNGVFHNWLYPGGKLAYLDADFIPGEPESLPIPLWGLSLIAAGLGLVLGWFEYRRGLPENEGWDLRKWSPFRKWAGNQFGYDAAVVQAGVEGGGELGVGVAWKTIDVGVVDGIVNGLASTTKGAGALLRKIQTGYVRNYAMMMAFGAILVIGISLLVYVSGGAR